MRVDPSGPRGASSGDVPPPPSSTGADATKTTGADSVAADIPPLTTSDDSDMTYVGSCLDRLGGSRTDFGGRS